MAGNPRTRLRDGLVEYVVAPSYEPVLLGEQPMSFSDDAAALRFLRAVSIDGDGPQAIGRLYHELDLGVPRAVSDEEIRRAIAARLATGALRIAAVGAPDVGGVSQQGVVGMNKVHVERMQHFCASRRLYIIVRAGNANGLRYHGERGFVSKPADVKAFKTAKQGQNAGLVALGRDRRVGAKGEPRPTSVTDEQWSRMTSTFAQWKKGGARHADVEATKPAQWGSKEWTLWQNEWENWLSLAAKGWSFDRAGVLRNPQGAAVHGDYDIQGVYRDLDDGFFEQIFAEAQLVEELNREVAPENPMFQHGANDEGGNVMDVETVTMLGSDGRDVAVQRAIMWREAEPDESFLVFHPSGALDVVNGLPALERFYSRKGWTWLYNHPNLG